MTLQVENILAELSDRPAALPAAVLEALAARFRPAGLFLLALFPDGKLAWHDRAAGAFFLRYVFPLVQNSELSNRAGDGAQPPRPSAGIAIDRSIPGVLLAVLPHVEKRQNLGFLVVAAREEAFALSEDALRFAGRLGLDGAWLDHQAGDVPGFIETALQTQARLVSGCLKDQLRLAGLEHELDSVSEQLASTYEELSLIYQVSGGMKVNRSSEDFFKQTCLDVLPVMGVRAVGVALGPEAHSPGAVLFGQMELPAGIIARLGGQLLSMLSVRKSALLINDLAANPQFKWLGEHARHLLAVPLQRYDKTLGCLFALDKEIGDFDSADAKLLNSIANESAIYLENAKLFEDAHGLMMGLLHSLTSAVDAKDAYTCGHSERVALLSRHLSQAAGLGDYEVEQVYMAGLLHDVGKIGVPESVLQKTGKLTPEEFELMKKHPRIGARILQDVRQVKHLIPGVLHHHERFDGAGYPDGLAGAAIPLMGRIICLADSFDAMTSNRTYRKALPLEVALTEIRRCAGTHFDPELAEAFLGTNADRYRELLLDHQQKSRKLLDFPEPLREHAPLSNR
ncbi:MAG TPA: HD domain-containing phosphohydrolase [Tepidisphaeraceae bacterium]|nr:HD domain-containing phosphohydrolase [Tepidisphaeraceae bacterium]